MNNKQRKLLNVSCKIEKLMYDKKEVKEFKKSMDYWSLIIDLENYTLHNTFLTDLINLLNKEKVSFDLNYERGFKLKIY